MPLLRIVLHALLLVIMMHVLLLLGEHVHATLLVGVMSWMVVERAGFWPVCVIASSMLHRRRGIAITAAVLTILFVWPPTSPRAGATLVVSMIIGALGGRALRIGIRQSVEET